MTSSCTNEDPYHPISLTFPEVLSVISLDFTTVILSLSLVTIRFRYRKINQGKNMPSYKILVLIDDEAVVGVYNFLLPQPKSHFSTSATHGSLSDGVG